MTGSNERLGDNRKGENRETSITDLTLELVERILLKYNVDMKEKTNDIVMISCRFDHSRTHDDTAQMLTMLTVRCESIFFFSLATLLLLPRKACSLWIIQWRIDQVRIDDSLRMVVLRILMPVLTKRWMTKKKIQEKYSDQTSRSPSRKTSYRASDRYEFVPFQERFDLNFAVRTRVRSETSSILNNTME